MSCCPILSWFFIGNVCMERAFFSCHRNADVTTKAQPQHVLQEVVLPDEPLGMWLAYFGSAPLVITIVSGLFPLCHCLTSLSAVGRDRYPISLSTVITLRDTTRLRSEFAIVFPMEISPAWNNQRKQEPSPKRDPCSQYLLTEASPLFSQAAM